MGTRPPSGTVTFLFTDVEGSTELWQDHPHAMAAALARHDEILRAAIGRHGGYVFSRAGDAFGAAFSTALDGVGAIADGQAALSNEPWGDAEIRIRAAIHTGEAEERDGDYFGPVLNRAARIMSLADGGQVLLSHAAAELVLDHLPGALSLRDVGTHPLRSLRRPEHVHQLIGPGLSDRELQVSPIERLGNLPAGIAEFIGRRHDLETLHDIVSPQRVVTLTGIGGVGKTQLAARAAASVSDRFRDGAWWCDLTSLRSSDLIPSAMATAVGFGLQPDMTPSQSVIDALGRRQTLLVIDNCEHLLDGVAALVESLIEHCPGLAVIATSREPLGTRNERVWPVQPLDAATEGVELLVQRAVAADASIDPAQWDRSDLVELCSRLDGIPLAIEMAASRLRTISPRQVIDRLDDRFRVLRSRRRRGDQRHETLLAMLDWSYDLLSSNEREFLDRLSVFAGSFDASLAGAVCSDAQLGDADLDDLLARLVERSLVVPVRDRPGGRFRLLETVRDYGAVHLDERGELEARRLRHAIAIADVIERAADEEADERYWHGHHTFVDCWTDVVAAMAWTIAVGEGELLGRLMRACTGHGTCVPRFELGELARAADEQAETPAVVDGFLAFFSDGTQQIEHAQAGLAKQPTDPWVRVLLSSQLAAGRASTGRPGILAAIDDARSAAHESGTRTGIAYWEAISAAVLARRNPTRAAEHAERAWSELEPVRRFPRASQTLGQLADYEMGLGRLESALELSEEAGALADAAGYEVLAAHAAGTSARIVAELSPEIAAPVLADALASARAARWWFNVWPVLAAAGRWFESMGNPAAGEIVDGFFGARGRSRRASDLPPPPETVTVERGEYRGRGAAMSADDVVDFVLDQLASTPRR